MSSATFPSSLGPPKLWFSEPLQADTNFLPLELNQIWAVSTPSFKFRWSKLLWTSPFLQPALKLTMLHIAGDHYPEEPVPFNVDELGPKGHLDISNPAFFIYPMTSLMKDNWNLNPGCACFSKTKTIISKQDCASDQGAEVSVLNIKPLVGMKTVFLCS